MLYPAIKQIFPPDRLDETDTTETDAFTWKMDTVKWKEGINKYLPHLLSDGTAFIPLAKTGSRIYAEYTEKTTDSKVVLIPNHMV